MAIYFLCKCCEFHSLLLQRNKVRVMNSLQHIYVLWQCSSIKTRWRVNLRMRGRRLKIECDVERSRTYWTSIKPDIYKKQRRKIQKTPTLISSVYLYTYSTFLNPYILQLSNTFWHLHIHVRMYACTYVCTYFIFQEKNLNLNRDSNLGSPDH